MGATIGTCQRNLAELHPAELCSAFDTEADSSSTMYGVQQGAARICCRSREVGDRVKHLLDRAMEMDVRAAHHGGASDGRRTREYTLPFWTPVEEEATPRAGSAGSSRGAFHDDGSTTEGADSLSAKPDEDYDAGIPDACQRKVPAAYEELEWCDRNLGMSSLVVLLLAEGQTEQAEPYCRRLVQLRERKLGHDNPSTLNSVTNLARILETLQRFDEAETLFRRAYGWHAERLGPDHPDTRALADSLTTVLRAQGKHGEAQAFCSHSHPEVFASSELEGEIESAIMESLRRRESEGEAEQISRRRHMVDKVDNAHVGPTHPGKFDGEDIRMRLSSGKVGVFDQSTGGGQRLEAVAASELTACVTRATELGMDDEAVLSLVRYLQASRAGRRGKHDPGVLPPEPAEAKAGGLTGIHPGRVDASFYLPEKKPDKLARPARSSMLPGTADEHVQRSHVSDDHGAAAAAAGGPHLTSPRSSCSSNHAAPDAVELCGAGLGDLADGHAGRMGSRNVSTPPPRRTRAASSSSWCGAGHAAIYAPNVSTPPPRRTASPSSWSGAGHAGAAGMAAQQVATSSAEADHDKAHPACAGGTVDVDHTVNPAASSSAPRASIVAVASAANDLAATLESEDVRRLAAAGEAARETPGTASDEASVASSLSVSSWGSSSRAHAPSEPSGHPGGAGNARAPPQVPRLPMSQVRPQPQLSPRGGRPPLPPSPRGGTVGESPRQKPISTRRFGGS